MRCPKCGGKGITDLYTPNVGRCTKCNGAGEITPTNEEWLRYATTEELAEMIAKMKLCYGYATFPSMEEAIQDAMGWLKAVHKE